MAPCALSQGLIACRATPDITFRGVGPVRVDGLNLIEAFRELEVTEDWLSTETP